MTIALTFIGHGLFAVGLHYQPGNFMQMTMNILGFDRIQASIFLLTVGLLDFIVVLGLLSSKTRIISLSYMILWGFLTALARSVFMLNEVSLAETFINYTPMTILRFPNSLLPLLLLLNYRTPRSKVFTLKNQTI